MEKEKIVSKSTGIAVGLVIALIVMASSGAFAVATWRGDIVRMGDQVKRVEAKLDGLTVSVQLYNDSANTLRSDIHMLRNRIDIMDATGTARLTEALKSMEARVSELEKASKGN